MCLHACCSQQHIIAMALNSPHMKSASGQHRCGFRALPAPVCQVAYPSVSLACSTSCRPSALPASGHDHHVSTAEPSPVQRLLLNRLDWCAGAAAAAIVLTSTVGCQPAGAAMAAQPYAMVGEDVISAEEARYDENLMTPELRSFIELLDKKGSDIKAEDLQGPRSKLNFRRGADGRVSLRARDGRWFNVKADMQTPGFLLLRAERDGSMFFLPPDDAGQLLQVDLSDDAVVAQLFSSGAWFDVMDPLKVESGSGSLEVLKLSETDFRLTSSLLDGAEEEILQ